MKLFDGSIHDDTTKIGLEIANLLMVVLTIIDQYLTSNVISTIKTKPMSIVLTLRKKYKTD